MDNSNSNPPSQPRNGNKISQRGLFSLAMLLLSLGSFAISMLAGAKMIFDILGEAPNGPGSGTKVIVVVLAYVVGWVTAVVAIRVYANLILPILINWLTWGFLAAVCLLYIMILQRMYAQPDDMGRFLKYLIVMAGSLSGLVGLHLIIEDHDLRPFSIPLLLINLIQLGLIVFRYVFDTAAVNFGFLWKDLVFFFGMTLVAVAMLAHWGVLNVLRRQITSHFDRNSRAIRPDN